MALFGIENQTEIEKDMPLRVISYDGAAYRAQLSKKAEKRQKTKYPVITMVLYFGNKRWNKNLSLKEVLNPSDDLAPFVSDYRINIFEIAYLSREQVNLFKSDFKIIADYFVQVRESGDYIPMPEDVTHVWETLNLMSAMTNDDRFETAVTEFELGKERVNMCEIIDKYIEKGIEQGKTEIAIALLSDGMSADKVSKLTKLSIEEILKVQNKLSFA